MKKLLLAAVAAFTITQAQAQVPKWETDPHYVGEFTLGYGTTNKYNGINFYNGRALIGMVHGVQVSQYLQVGVGMDVGLKTHYYKGHGMRMMFDVYADIRGMYPVTKDFSPFIDMGYGVYYEAMPWNNKGAFFFQFGPGLRYKKLHYSFGLQKLGKGKGTNTFYTKLGFYF